MGGKQMRKLTTMFLAGAMAASLMAVPVQAEEATGTVTIKLAHNMDFVTIPEAIVAAADRLNERYEAEGKDLHIEIEDSR